MDRESQHVREFSRRADSYDAHTDVQKQVASYLLQKIDFHPKKILDLGCGTGEIYRNVAWELDAFVAVDNSSQMLQRHPKDKCAKLICEDFDSQVLHNMVKSEDIFDLVVSSSALQWSKNIEEIVKLCTNVCKYGAFAIFTEGTFEQVRRCANLNTFLPSSNFLIEVFKKYFTFTYEVKTFRLPFDDTIIAFRYMKKSGVSGGTKRLSVSQMRALIRDYPLDYLEFEVLFIWGKPL
ncbi:MAG: methyltransferase domain-containing protein [Sulfurospirillaceae bacterium]|nr:methyltransferase domain-containing protein [Sulfurospirillaceae bacterium]